MAIINNPYVIFSPKDPSTVDMKYYKVQHYMFNGELLKEFWQLGGTEIETPDYEPTHSDSRLMFKEWHCTTTDTIIQNDVIWIAQFGLKRIISDFKWDNGLDGDTTPNLSGALTGVLDCCFYANDSVSIKTTNKSTNQGSHFAVDWGDGNHESFSGGQTLTHTYENDGVYSINFYCTANNGVLCFTDAENNYILGSETLNSRIMRAYFGEAKPNFYVEFSQYAFYGATNLEEICVNNFGSYDSVNETFAYTSYTCCIR